MLDTIQTAVAGGLVPVMQAFGQLIAVATAHPIISFEIAAVASIYFLNRDSSAI